MVYKLLIYFKHDLDTICISLSLYVPPAFFHASHIKNEIVQFNSFCGCY
jgi:hypothetical protein